MDISMRSYLAMGAAAVMGAGTMALAPAVTTLPALNTHRVVSDDVDLASFGTLIYIAGTAVGLDPATGTDPISLLGTALINVESAVTGLDLVGFSTAVGNDLRGIPSGIQSLVDSIPQGVATLAAIVDSLPSVSLPELVDALPQLIEYLPSILLNIPLPSVSLPQLTDSLSQLVAYLPSILPNVPSPDFTGFGDTLPQLVDAVSQLVANLPSVLLNIPLPSVSLPQLVDSASQLVAYLPSILANVPPLDFTGFGDALTGGITALSTQLTALLCGLTMPTVPSGILTNGLIGTLGSAVNLLTSNYSLDFNSAAANWGPYAMPFSGANFITSALSNGGAYPVPGLAELGGYSKVGLIPQIVADGLPILSQLGVNAQDYLATTIAKLTGGDILGALAYTPTGVIARAGAVLAVLPSILANLSGSVVGGAGVLFNEVVELVNNVVTELSTLDVLGAIGATRSGLLGPSGIPGALVNLTIGAGVQTGTVDSLADVVNGFVPSKRTVVQQGVKDIAAALATPVPVPATLMPANTPVVQLAPEAAASVSAPEASPVASRGDVVTESAPVVPVAEVPVADVEVPKVEVAEVEVADVEVPKVEAAEIEAAEVEAAEVEAAEVEAAEIEVAEVEAPKVEAAEIEAPKVEAPSAVTKVADEVASVKDRVSNRSARSSR